MGGLGFWGFGVLGFSMISQTSDFFATTNVIDAIPVKYSMLEPMGLKMLGKYPAVLPAAYE